MEEIVILDAFKVLLILLQIKKNLVCEIFTPLTVILYKRLKIDEPVRQKMGAEQRRLNRYEQRRKMPDF